MQSTIVLAIDGTGSTEWSRSDHKNSHIYRFYDDIDCPVNQKQYMDGPGTAGKEMPGIIDSATQWVLNQVHKITTDRSAGNSTRQEDINICMIGTSRGCVAAMKVANNLANESIQIRYMGLYDAVQRTYNTWKPDLTLPNVASIRHAQRGNFSWFGGSRGSFGRLDLPNNIRVNQQDFDTSHGGMGGDPGWFDSLIDPGTDNYCEALTLILDDESLGKRYGYKVVGRGVTKLVPNYRQLKGDAAVARIGQLQGFLEQSIAVDNWVREGASDGNVFRFKKRSAFISFHEKYMDLASLLSKAINRAPLGYIG